MCVDVGDDRAVRVDRATEKQSALSQESDRAEMLRRSIRDRAERSRREFMSLRDSD